jgi:hypothetical protein
MLQPHVFLHNFANFYSKSKILDICQQRMEWAQRKHILFLVRMLRELRNHKKQSG